MRRAKISKHNVMNRTKSLELYIRRQKTFFVLINFVLALFYVDIDLFVNLDNNLRPMILT